MTPSSYHPVARSSLVIALSVTICLGSSPEMPDDTTFFAIRSNYSGKCLSFNVPQAGALVDCDGSPSQWFYRDDDYIKPAQDPNKCITAPDLLSLLYLDTCEGSPRQAWNYSANQLTLVEDSAPKTHCLIFETGLNQVIYITNDYNVCIDPQEAYPEFQHQWHLFDVMDFQTQKAPFQVTPTGHAGCLIAKSTDGLVEFATVCSDASEALFKQAWYFDNVHIRNLGFFFTCLHGGC